MLFADVCAGFISSCYGGCGKWRLGGFLAFLWRLVHMGEVLALLVYTLLCARLGSPPCASCWTRNLGGGPWGHYLCDLWRDCLAAHKTAKY